MSRTLRFLCLGAGAGLAFVAGLAAAGTAASAGKTAIVCFLEGKAWMAERSGSERREVRLFDWLSAESSLETAPGARLILAFSDGRRYELGERTTVTLGKDGLASQKGSVTRLESVPVMPQIASIADDSKRGSRLGGIRLRTFRRTISGLYPNEGEAVLADTAILEFNSLEGVKRYGIEVEDEQGDGVFSAETEMTRVPVPPGLLEPGTGYYWQVRTLDRERPPAVSYAAFVTVAADQARLRESFKAQVERSQDAANILLLAEMEITLGLRREACATLREALKRFPGNAEIENAISRIGCK